MCGIVCCINQEKTNNVKKLEKALDRVKYRGPDASGYYLSFDETVFLGHSRLSIIDLSSIANQPMFSKEKDNVLIFNGEIYNYIELREELIGLDYKFDTQSDSEVILNGFTCWGIGLFSRLNGPFSIVLYSIKLNRLWVARDRAGEKPLYYCQKDSSMAFASDTLAVSDLLESEKTISLKGIHSYLMHGYTTDNFNLISEVKSIPPGTVLDIDCKTLNFKMTDFRVSSRQTKYNYSLNGLANQTEMLDLLLSESVKKQLRCDVPVAVMLSGGVDSSLITAYAAKFSGKLNTFTVSFPGYKKFDEASRAQLIANNFSTNHTVIDGVEIQPEIMLDLVKSLELPIIDSSLIPTYILYKEVSRHYKVALGGDGADELFGGYKHYSRFLAFNKYGLLTEQIMRLLSHSGFLDINKRLKFSNWTELFKELKGDSIFNIRRYASDTLLGDLLMDNYSDKTIGNVNKQWREQYIDLLSINPLHSKYIDKLMAADFSSYLRNSILVKSDRCSMMNGVEARAPFLDKEIIDFSLNYLPSEAKVSYKDKKIILKELCKKKLPHTFDLNRKLGFNLPFAEMIRHGRWYKFINEVLLSSSKLFSLDTRRNLLDEHLKGVDHSHLIFGITLLFLWADKEGIEI